MFNFSIFETENFIEDLDNFPKDIITKVKFKLENYVYNQLRNNPFYGKNIKKLINYHPETWRYRIGNYRFFYEIDAEEKLVIMISAHHRKDSY